HLLQRAGGERGRRRSVPSRGFHLQPRRSPRRVADPRLVYRRSGHDAHAAVCTRARGVLRRRSRAPLTDPVYARGTIRPSMRLGTRVWGIGKFLILVGALGLTFLVFFGVAMRVALRAREVEVPSLSGRTVNDATRMAAALGLGLRVDDNQRSDEKIPAGR